MMLATACLMMSFFQSYAQQRRQRSTIRITLSDGSPLTLAVNDRYFKKVGKRITISDLPGKRPYFKIYKYRPYQNGKGGKAELVFSGMVKIQRGKSYEAVVNVKNGKLTLREGIKTVSAEQEDTYISPEHITMMPQLESLKQQMDRQAADMNKLKLAQGYTNKNTYTTDELADMASWLLFDDTRLAFLKYTYEKVQNPQQYAMLEAVFSTEESKTQFRDFLQTRKK